MKDEQTIDFTSEVKSEERKMLKLLEGLSSEQLKTNKEFIHQVSFQSIALKYLADDIAKNGVKEKYCNGANQWGYKDRTEVKTYNNMFKNYQSAMKQLNDLVAISGKSTDDNFEGFAQ